MATPLMPNHNQKSTTLEKLTLRITEWMGTPQSVLVHTVLFGGIFLLKVFGFGIDQIMLILTTAVSLEAIYLSLFIQMTVNRNTASLEEVEEDIEELQEDVEVIEGDFSEIKEDVEDISEDIDKLKEEDQEGEEERQNQETRQTLGSIEQQLIALTGALVTLKADIEMLKKKL